MSDSSIPPLKRCTKCGREFPATPQYFARRRRAKDVLHCQCKACMKEKARVYYLANRERTIERVHAYSQANKAKISERGKHYREKNRELIRDRSKRYNVEHKEGDRERKRRYRDKHRARINAKSQQWTKDNQDRRREIGRNYYARHKKRYPVYVRNRRARLKAAEGTHTSQDIERQYKAQRGLCYYCHCELGETYHVDHVVPIDRGGSNGPDNLVIACSTCNRKKNNKLPHEWPEGGRLL